MTKKDREVVTQLRLKSVLDYYPKYGCFCWNHRLNRRGISSGAIAGCRDREGYIIIQIDGLRYFAHRLAFLWMTGEMPDEVDHINGNRSDNRWVNLRPADRVSNGHNKKRAKNNTSGFKGVSWHKQKNKFHSRIKVRDKSFHLGYFDNAIDAHRAYVAAAESMCGGFHNPG